MRHVQTVDNSSMKKRSLQSWRFLRWALFFCIYFFKPSFAQTYVDVKNYILGVDQEAFMIKKHGFAVQERIEIYRDQKNKPLYRFMLCQYTVHSKSHDPIFFQRQQGVQKYTLQEHLNSENVSSLQKKFIHYLQGQEASREWLHADSLFVQDLHSGLNCLYYLDEGKGYLKDSFVSMHSSMDTLFECPQSDAYLKMGSGFMLLTVIATRFPLVLNYVRGMLPGFRLASLLRTPVQKKAWLSFQGLLQALEKGLSVGRFNPLQYEKIRALLKVILASVAAGKAYDQCESCKAWVQENWVPVKNAGFKQWLQEVVNEVRFVTTMGNIKCLSLADSGCYLDFSKFTRIDSGVVSTQAAKTQSHDNTLLLWLNYKRDVFFKTCFTSNFLENEYMDVALHFIERKQGGMPHIELYYGYLFDALSHAKKDRSLWDLFHEGSAFISED